MVDIRSTDAGVASVQTDTFTTIEVLAGDTPAQYTDTAIIPAAIATAGLPAWTPVYRDPETQIISLAVAGTTEPNAITPATIAAGSPANSRMPLWMAGCYNIRALNWPASYNTDALKYGAFAGQDNCQIFIKKPYGVA